MQTKNASFIVLCAIFAFLLFCNIMLPPQSDDLNHAFSAQEGFQSAINSYMNWNARIGELLNVGFFAGLNPYFFDLLNAAVGVAFFAIFFTLIFARLPRDFKDASTLALIALTILYLAPFGSVFAWGAGSVNYLWGLTLILAFLLPYRVAFLVAFLPLNKNGGGNRNNLNFLIHLPKLARFTLLTLFLPFSFCAGMASEQIGILTILALLALNALALYRKVRIPAILHIAFLCFIAGWLALYFSPGHAKRATHPAFDGFYMTLGEILALDFVALIKRVYMAVSNFGNRILLVFSGILAVVAFVKFAKINARNIALFILFIVLVLVVNNNVKIFWTLFLIANVVALGILAWREFRRESCESNRKSCVIQRCDSSESRESLESSESLRKSQNGQNSYAFRICFALLLAFCLCALSTIQFPGLPYRARLGDSLILIAAICVLWDRFVNFALIQKGIIALCAAYALFVGFCYVEYRVKWQNMVAFIEAQKAQGVREIEVENIFHSRYKNFMNWGNPGKNADEWPNTTYAQYFGVEKFRVK